MYKRQDPDNLDDPPTGDDSYLEWYVIGMLASLAGLMAVSYTHLGYAVLDLLRFDVPISLTAIFIAVVVFALVRGVLRLSLIHI